MYAYLIRCISLTHSKENDTEPEVKHSMSCYVDVFELGVITFTYPYK